MDTLDGMRLNGHATQRTTGLAIPEPVSIALSKPEYSMRVDQGDWGWMCAYRWTACVQRLPTGRIKVYAYRRKKTCVDGVQKQKMIYAHREIVARRIGWEALNGYVVDHHDGDSLHNTGHNLRVVTQHYNTLIGNNSEAASAQHGVTYENYPSHPRKLPWRARIHNPETNTTEHLGYFATEQEASAAYDARASELGLWTFEPIPLVMFVPAQIIDEDIPF